MTRTKTSMTREPRTWLRGTAAASALALGVFVAGIFHPAPTLARSATVGGTRLDPSGVREALRHHVLHTLDGGSLSFDSLRGEVVVVNFWASWCRPCRKELPELDALHTEISKSGGRVVAVSIDDDDPSVRRFVRAHGLGLPVYRDGSDGLARALDLDHIPFTLVLDRNGQVAFTTSGSNAESLAELRSITRRLLADDPRASRVETEETR